MLLVRVHVRLFVTLPLPFLGVVLWSSRDIPLTHPGAFPTHQ